MQKLSFCMLIDVKSKFQSNLSEIIKLYKTKVKYLTLIILLNNNSFVVAGFF